MTRAKALMIQGTASNAGKSWLVAGLCRIFRQDGFSVAPFKSQNMALNSFITDDGLEMGRAQVAQAEASGLAPSVLMNPILLKPTGDATSQVVVDGRVVANMRAAEYYRRKTEFIPAVRRAYDTLSSRHDVVVIEGAGSPAEINLRDNDIVNMGMAVIADAPVLLVGDIDRGGVFASLYGTVLLLEPDERARVKGLVINKFRGDPDILRPGLGRLEELTGAPVLGIVPWVRADIDDEDSVSSRLDRKRTAKPLDVAVVRLPRLSNFTDFNPLDRHPAFGVRYVERLQELGEPDLLILPGTKNTIADLLWLRQNGLEPGIMKLAAKGVPIIGICGGFQMLGEIIDDSAGTESGGVVRGIGLFPLETVFAPEKTRTRVSGKVSRLEGFFSALSGAEFAGYEIHMGETTVLSRVQPFAVLSDGTGEKSDGAVLGNVMGTYAHGLFDSGSVADRLAEKMLRDKGLEPVATGSVPDPAAYKEEQYDLLAAALREALDMEAIYRIAGL